MQQDIWRRWRSSRNGVEAIECRDVRSGSRRGHLLNRTIPAHSRLRARLRCTPPQIPERLEIEAQVIGAEVGDGELEDPGAESVVEIMDRFCLACSRASRLIGGKVTALVFPAAPARAGIVAADVAHGSMIFGLRTFGTDLDIPLHRDPESIDGSLRARPRRTRAQPEEY